MSANPITEPSDRPLTEPHTSRLDPSLPNYRQTLRVHELALQSGQPGYIDPQSGLYVMTAQYLLDRGFCCDNGCRHCPFVAN